MRKEQIAQRRASVPIRLSVSPQASVEGHPLTLIRGETFRKVVAELEGYDSSGMGEVMSKT